MASHREVASWWRTIRETAEVLVFPMTCQICGIDGIASPFCDDCRVELVEAGGPTCPRCAMTVGPFSDLRSGCMECRGRTLGFDSAVALGPYQGPIRHLCLRMKRVDQGWLSRWLADVLIESRGDPLRASTASAVVPVPLHWSRRWNRGYNQAEALAHRLADRLGLRLVRCLRRIKATGALGPLGRVERFQHMHGAFKAMGHRVEPLRGRTVLLVDDILTTGATCGAAARALKDGGVARVVAVVIGRAEGRA